METYCAEAFDVYLRPTYFIDSDNVDIIGYAKDSAKDAETHIQKAISIFYAVRDEITYDPYRINLARSTFRASVVLAKGYGFCVEKAILLAAAARALGIPSRLRFADVRNHLTTQRLKEIMNTNVFYFHGYTELFLNDRWIKATPTFNLSLCERFGVHPLEFDGTHDSIFHEFDRKGSKHMEYIHDHGPFADLPYEALRDTFETHYSVFLEEHDLTRGNFEEEAEEERTQRLS